MSIPTLLTICSLLALAGCPCAPTNNLKDTAGSGPPPPPPRAGLDESGCEGLREGIFRSDVAYFSLPTIYFLGTHSSVPVSTEELAAFLPFEALRNNFELQHSRSPGRDRTVLTVERPVQPGSYLASLDTGCEVLLQGYGGFDPPIGLTAGVERYLLWDPLETPSETPGALVPDDMYLGLVEVLNPPGASYSQQSAGTALPSPENVRLALFAHLMQRAV